ncbi:peptide chain release factor N(5)-glutamine methyltransferase [Aliidiomarina minuta]|uniref:Release factor glutamine methyltransferase n=1 Tax=Aliidiomarina minuta TaxID=880057 RepID=A0A432W5I6_9GAMM|nr:peptide chain release factor N(5)-glutamine methyltransferase [Aliidiomarina minuta]RUO25333.1 peptide chain release factor N(5)-glutamine methyltransferase [Aliidiomarina minuta]
MNSNYQLVKAIQYARTQIAQGGSESALLDAQLLLQHILGCDRQWLYMHPEHPMTDTEWDSYRELVERRRKGEPIAYILGQREFWSLTLDVNATTLIPRPDTERLVEAALALDLPHTAKVLELGTGTGAIALALASERPEWQIDAVDYSAQAVQLAQGNGKRLKLPQVTVFQSDWFSEVKQTDYDLIISNPPYIAAEDMHLEQGDLRYEPHSALVAADKGFADLDHIISCSRGYLKAQSWVMVEHGFAQGAKVREIFTEKGYKKVNTLTDYANLDRVTYAQCSNPNG